MQMEPGWPAPLCSGLQHYLDLLTPGLASEAHQEVSRALLARLLIRIEGALKTLQFTALGGLLLDRCADCTCSSWRTSTGLCGRHGPGLGYTAGLAIQGCTSMNAAVCDWALTVHGHM